MKHRLITMLLIFALLLATAGCSAAGAMEKLDAAEDRVENKLEAAEDSVENAVQRAVTPAPAATPSLPAPTPTETVASGETITREEAEKIALDYLGFTADQVTRLRTEYEIDDGVPQYDVEFLNGDWEYEFEIHAENGKILSFDKDHKYD